MRCCDLCETPLTYVYAEESEYIICHKCIYKMDNTSEEKLKDIHSTLVRKGYSEKSKLLATFINTGDACNTGGNDEDREITRTLDGTGTSGKALCKNKSGNGKKPSHRELGV